MKTEKGIAHVQFTRYGWEYFRIEIIDISYNRFYGVKILWFKFLFGQVFTANSHRVK